MLETIIKILFTLSLCVIAFFLGWYLGFSEYHLLFVLCVFAVTCFITLYQRGITEYKSSILVVLFGLLGGYFVAQSNILNASLWIEQSLEEITSMPSHTDLKKTQSSLLDLEIQPNTVMEHQELGVLELQDPAFDKPIIFSIFKEFPIFLVHQGKIKKLQPKGNIIVADDTYIYHHNPSTKLFGKSTIAGDTIWNVPTPSFHHWGDVFDGKIYVPSREFTKLPNKTSQALGGKYSECKARNGWSENVTILDDENGEIKKQISILPLLVDLRGDPVLDFLSQCQDPVHLNEIKIIKTQKEASYFPNGKVGDILVSLRNLHGIFLLDRDNDKIKWHVFGKFNRQHSPLITDRGTLLVFDNKGSDPANGLSRVLEIDIRTQEVVGLYESQNPKAPFHSPLRGKIQILENRLFVYANFTAEEDDAYPYKDDDSYVFELVCPGKYISNECERKNIFRLEKDFMFGQIFPGI